MSLGETIRSGVRWVFVGKAGQQLLSFAIGVVLARLLLPEHFGLLVTVQIFTGLAAFVSGGGLGQALVQSKEMTLQDTHVVFTAQLVIGFLIYFLFFISAPWFAAWYEEPIYEALLRISALTFLLRPFFNTSMSILHRDMRFKTLSFIHVGVLVATGSSSITMALLGFEVWSLVLSGILGALLNVTLAAWASGWRARLAYDKEVLKRLGGYGLKVSGVNIVLYLKKQAGNFVIGHTMGPASVGLFNKATSLYEIPGRMITGSAHHVVFRALSTIQDNLDKSKYVYLRSVTLASVYALPAYVGLWWVAEPFIHTVYGAKWVPAAPVLEILVTAGFFVTVGSLSGAVGAARRLLGRELVVQAFTLALLGGAAWYATRWGITGVAWAVLGVAVITSFLMAGIACRELRVRPRELARALRPAVQLNLILMATLAATHAFLLEPYKSNQPYLYLLGMAAVGSAAYGACFLFLPVPELRKEANRWKRRIRLTAAVVD